MGPVTTPDWSEALAAAIAHLQALIRIESVNPPGNETAVALYLDTTLQAAGITTTLVEPTLDRATLVANLRGNGARRPLLLLAHMDTVGVEPTHWTQRPFAGDVVDGHVYGRGAIDDKGMLAVNLQTMLLLKQHVLDAGLELQRDVVFVASADEETGGPFGIDYLIAHRPELLDAEFALNEGGRVRVVGDRPSYCAVQCAEKVPYSVIVTARGTSGHASVPLPDNPIARLATAVAAVAAHREPLMLTDVTRQFFGALAPSWPDRDDADAMADIASSDASRVRRGAAHLSRSPSYDAMLRNGVSPTMLSGGIRSNVIPADASCTLNVRLLPGQSIDDLVERLRTAIGDRSIEVLVRGRGKDAPSMPLDSPMFAAIRDAVHELEPGLPVVPYLSTGATDSAALRQSGIAAYGLLPFPLTQDDENRMHGHDERVPVASFEFGLRLVYGIVQRMAMRSNT